MPSTHVTAVLSREWRPQPPATQEQVSELLAALPFRPPDDYIELLLATNGGEGELALEPQWFQLFDAAFAIHLLSDASYREEYPSYFFFGSNGGLESIALVTSGSEQGKIITVDCVAGVESSIVIANSFAEFLAQVGVRGSEA